MNRLNLFYRARRGIVIAIIFMVAGVPAMLWAQQQSFKLSDHSTANLFLGAPDDPKSFDVGVAKVSGEMRVEPDDLSASRFDFTISASPNPPSGSGSRYTNGKQSFISFHSQQVRQRSDGTLEARGQLTVTQAFRQVATSTAEDYPALVSETESLFQTSREATFILAGVQYSEPAGGSSNSHVASLKKLEPGMLLTASTRVNGEDFPELLLSIEDVAWPASVHDERCDGSSAVNGTVCSDEVSSSPVLLAQQGEDYAGIPQTVPTGQQVTIQLNLRLAGANNTPLVDRQQTQSAVQPPEAH